MRRDARAEGRRRKEEGGEEEGENASPPSVRVAAACNTCNTSDRDEEEACSGTGVQNYEKIAC